MTLAAEKNGCSPLPRASHRHSNGGHQYSSADLQWKGDVLHLGGKGRALVRIVPDQTYPTMWRIELPDGRLSDMANRTRAKDAARSIALQMLNHREAA